MRKPNSRIFLAVFLACVVMLCTSIVMTERTLAQVGTSRDVGTPPRMRARELGVVVGILPGDRK